MYLFQIKEFLRKKLPRSHVFVTSVNTLPTSFSLPMAVCTNLSRSNELGSHWVGIVINARGEGEYFDSYGRKPTSPEILRFLRMHTIRWSYNKRQIQQLSSSVCGHYVCLYIYYRLKNIPLETFLTNFTANLFLNDYGVVKMFQNFDRNKQ